MCGLVRKAAHFPPKPQLVINMNSFNNILDMFPEREMKDNLNDIIVVIDELSHKTPVVGFHHSFYVPGWIGFF